MASGSGADRSLVFAAYNRASARWSTRYTSSPAAPDAQPILTPAGPVGRTNAATASSMRRATIAGAPSEGSGISRTNSSPPMRASVSPLRVAAAVTVAVVDELEVVDVDGEDRERVPGAELIHGVLEAATVGQAGERIGDRVGFGLLMSERVGQRQRGQRRQASHAFDQLLGDGLVTRRDHQHPMDCVLDVDRDVRRELQTEASDELSAPRPGVLGVERTRNRLAGSERPRDQRVLGDRHPGADFAYTAVIAVRDDPHGVVRYLVVGTPAGGAARR